MIVLFIVLFSFPAFATEPTIIGGRGDIIWSLAFSPDSKILASGSEHDIGLWSMDKMAWVNTLASETCDILSMDFSPDGKLLAASNGGATIELWNMSTMEYVAVLEGHKREVIQIDFSPDGKLLVSCSLASDSTIRIWDVQTRKCTDILSAVPEGDIFGSTCWSVAFSPDGRYIASASHFWGLAGSDYMVQLWDIGAKSCLVTLEGENPPVAFSPDGTILASGGKLWDLSQIISNPKTKEIARFGNEYADGFFSPDGEVIAWAFNGGINFFNIKDNLTSSFSADVSDVMSVAFSPDGKFVAIGDIYGKIAIWNFEEIERPVEPKGKLSTTWGKIKTQ